MQISKAQQSLKGSSKGFLIMIRPHRKPRAQRTASASDVLYYRNFSNNNCSQIVTIRHREKALFKVDFFKSYRSHASTSICGF